MAAYGVVANFALVATAIFNGVAQGAQPLVSRCYGHSDRAGARKLLILGSCTALALAAVLYAVVFGMTDTLVGWFNSENSAQMAGLPTTACGCTSWATSLPGSTSWRRAT